MHIPTEIWAVILTVAFGLIAFLSNRAIFKKMDDSDKKVDKLTGVVEAMANDNQKFKETALKDFITKVDMRVNDMAHKELWSEINSLRERTAKLEGRDSN
jgi:hypothetical protein